MTLNCIGGLGALWCVEFAFTGLNKLFIKPGFVKTSMQIIHTICYVNLLFLDM